MSTSCWARRPITACRRWWRVVARAEGAVLDTDFPAEAKFDFLPEPDGEAAVSAFLTIQEGCDKFCTFCVVPYTRGAEFSRPAAAVLAEARGLVARGAREITLLGQNVNAYHGASPDGGTWGLGRLLRALAEIAGLERLRYTTSHPLDVDDELVAAHRDVPSLMPFLHLPVQSGSDRVLAAMNRRHCADDYRRIVAKLRAARADLALSSDFIVGFPGESDADFAATLALVREIGFAQAFSFKYSRRPGTPAARLAEQVPDAVKAERLAALQALLGEQQRRFNEAVVGRMLPVLFEQRRPARGPARRPQPVASAGPCDGAARIDRPRRAGRDRARRAQQPRRRARVAGCRVTGTPHPREAADVRVQMQFADNSLLPQLFGERDRNLERIERQLGVSLVSRGNRVAITGPAGRPEMARAALQSLYDRLERGQEIDAAAVDAALRLAQARRRCGMTETRIRTRRRRIAPRSPEPGAVHPGAQRARSGVRPRPCRHRQDLSRRRHGGRHADDRRGRAHRAVAPGGRGGRAAGLPARRSAREGRPLSAPAL